MDIMFRSLSTQTITWAFWAFRVRHPHRTQLYTFLLLLNAATALEVTHCWRQPIVPGCTAA